MAATMADTCKAEVKGMMGGSSLSDGYYVMEGGSDEEDEEGVDAGA